MFSDAVRLAVFALYLARKAACVAFKSMRNSRQNISCLSVSAIDNSLDLVKLLRESIGSAGSDIVQLVKNITAIGLLFYPLIPKAVKVVNDVVISKGAAMKKRFEKCMNTVKRLTSNTEEVAMVDVALFYLGCWVTFPLPMDLSHSHMTLQELPLPQLALA